MFFYTRWPYANEKIGEIWKLMVNTTEDMIKKLQELKRKTNLKFHKNLSNYYDELKHKNFQTQEDLFSKTAKGIS